MTNKPISLDDLLSLAANELAPDVAREINSRLVADPAAQATLQRIRAVQHVARGDDSVAPPADVLARAQALFAERRRPQPAGILETARRVLAELLFDSRLTPALQGVRGGAKGYQVAYQSELLEIEFEVAPFAVSAGTQRTVIGQITPTADVPVRMIELHAADGTVHEIAPDAGGVFTTRIDTGSYRITCRCDDAEVVIEDVRID